MSSQCQKYGYRHNEMPSGLAEILGKMSIRSRHTFYLRILPEAKAALGEGCDEALLIKIVSLIKAEVVKAKVKDVKAEDAEVETEPGVTDEAKGQTMEVKGQTVEEEPEVVSPDGDIKKLLMTKQVVVMGPRETDQVVSEIVRVYQGCQGDHPKYRVVGGDKKGKKVKPLGIEFLDADGKVLTKGKPKSAFDLGKLKNAWDAAGLDAFLFGRMAVSDFLEEEDARVHVAHAFTVHEELTEGDEFIAADDLDQGHGAAHMNSADLSSGLYYKYMVIDVGGIEARLRDSGISDGDFTAALLELMVYMTTVAPMGAKRGSTAPYTRASMLLVEVGNACPASMAEAFDKPVEAEDVGMHLSACKALATYIKDRDANYPQYVNRYFAMALGGDSNLQ